MQTADVTLATHLMVEDVYRLMEACKINLDEQQIYQWTEAYPNREFVEYSIESNELFVLRVDDRIVGTVVLNEYQSPEWSSVAWHRNEGNYLIIHALCIDPHSQHSGYGHKVLDFCESFARERGYESIRLDAFSENEVALRFYEKRGYQKMGEVMFASKPLNHQTYYCYEKLLER